MKSYTSSNNPHIRWQQAEYEQILQHLADQADVAVRLKQ